MDTSGTFRFTLEQEVDLSDAKRKVYSCTRRSKKWWHRLFYFIVDTCIVNALIIHNENSHTTKINQEEFRLELARELLALYSSRKHHKRGRASLEGNPSTIFKEQHFIDKLAVPQQCRVCSKNGVRKRTTFGCKDCNSQEPLPLCITPCYRLHHTK